MGTLRWSTKTARKFSAYYGAESVVAAIPTCVRKLREEASIAGHVAGVHRPPYDPIPLASALGAEVRRADLDFDGHLRREGNGIIIEVAADQHRSTRRRFTIAHEVAHMQLWRIMGTAPRRLARSSDGEIERLCNLVAVQILAPAEEVQHLWDRTADKESLGANVRFIRDIARHFDISLSFAALRFRDICQPNLTVGLFDRDGKRFVWNIGFPEVSPTYLAKKIDPENSHGRDGLSLSRPGGTTRMIPFSWHQLAAARYFLLAPRD